VSELEVTIMRRIRAACARQPGVLLWRNNVGVDVERGITYGLGKGSADLVGIAPGGRFLALEVKRPRYSPSDVRPEQRAWISVVTKFGGLAGVASSPEEALRIIEGA
jgi:Holliday junction resolvase